MNKLTRKEGKLTDVSKIGQTCTHLEEKKLQIIDNNIDIQNVWLWLKKIENIGSHVGLSGLFVPLPPKTENEITPREFWQKILEFSRVFYGSENLVLAPQI